MKNDFNHNADGTTTIYIESLDRLLEMTISTEDFHILESRGYNICAIWNKVSRTWYAICRGKHVHRLLKGDPEGQHVHHIDRNGLNNTRENLEVVTPSEHFRKERSKEPIVGDSIKGIPVHFLSKAEANKKFPDKRFWFRLDVNGLHYNTFDNFDDLNLHSTISDMVVNHRFTDEQIYARFLRVGHKKEHVAAVIKEVRRFFRTPDSSMLKGKIANG
ncbi:HNH endonuclease [Neobacillus sp. NPDC093127]|uniref:HNH endonuclease n=1 Tax=Neobacillus sp. NPDC093127 TaxID=3364296 RepID=UPI003820DF94